MYRAYFIQEQDIGQVDVLCGLAKQAGLDEADFRQALEEGRCTQREQEAVRYTREVLKPRGVPTIYVDGREITLNTYTEEEMLQALNDAAFSVSGHFCGPEGC